jgi:SH3-like domain-containing protein
VQAKGAPGKGQNAKGEQRGHVPPPVAVVPPPVAPPPPAAAATEPSEPAPKLPRFAALKTDETNMRKGPGQRYPIDWVYQRHDLPVEVEREYDVWRYVRDPDGTQGWVHQVTLSDRRTFMIKGKDAMLRSAANDTASPVAELQAGVIGRLRECAAGSQWCEVQAAGYRGYLRRDQIWGLLPDEVLAPS